MPPRACRGVLNDLKALCLINLVEFSFILASKHCMILWSQLLKDIIKEPESKLNLRVP
jgi:hypothetical protein